MIICYSYKSIINSIEKIKSACFGVTNRDFFKNVNYRLIVGADEHGLKQGTKYKDIWFEGYCMRSRPLFLHTGIKWIVQFKSMLSDEFCFLLFKWWKGGWRNFLCVRSTTHTQCSIHYHYGNSCHDHEKKFL